MREKNDVFDVYSIGYVKEYKFDSKCNGMKYLEIDEVYRPALEQLKEFSHLIVLWWADENDDMTSRDITKGILPYSDCVEVGIFATRSPFRPNPIALTVCEILNIDEDKGTIEVGNIDANNGSPILDLKPYIPVCDRVQDVRVADWVPEDWREWWVPDED